jgi:hypothetical protein
MRSHLVVGGSQLIGKLIVPDRTDINYVLRRQDVLQRRLSQPCGCHIICGF